MIVGTALGWAGASVTFWMGSSHGSQAKDATIAAQAGAKIGAPPP